MPLRHDSLTSFAHPVPRRRSWLDRLRLWIGVAREREALARLDARLLSDIGVSAEAADREARRPCWDIDRPS